MRLKSNLMESIINNIKESDDHDKSNYMMLSRLKSDCDYYLGNGNRNPRNLWAGDEAKQIAKMRELYDKVPEEPEWLTKEDIDDYEDKMINGSEDSPENHIENPTVIEDKNSLKEDNEEAEDITYILDEYNGEVDFVTKEELGLDYSYRVLITSVSEAQEYNYHSDYWGSDSEYQEQNVDLMWQLEKYVGKTVKIKFEDTTVYAKLIGILIDKQYNSIDHTKILIEPINMNESSQESSLKDNRNNVIKELSSIIEGAGLTYEEVFEDIYTRAGENSELIDIVLSNMLSDYKEYLGESSKYNREEIIKELSNVLREANISFKELFDDMFTRAGENSELIDIILSNMLEDYKEYLGEAAKIATKYNLKESSANGSSNIKELEKYIKGSTLNDAAKFLGMYFHGDRDSFEVQGSELIDKKHKDNRIACSMDGDKIDSIANDLSNLKEDSYEDNIFTDIEAALNQYGFDVTRYTEAGMMTNNIGWVVSNSEGEVNLTCAGTYLDEKLNEENEKELKNKLSTEDLTESDESSPLKNVAEVIKRIITECNGEISYIDCYKDSISIKAAFKADSISLYENDITLYGDLKFDNNKLIKSDLMTSSGPNVLNNDFIKCLNTLYDYLVSGNSGYDL